MTFAVWMQVPYCILSEVSLSDIQRCDRWICQATSVSTVQAKGASSGAGVECAAWPCASDSWDTAEVCGVRVHGIPKRQTGDTIVLTIRKSGETVLGQTLVGARLLCQHGWTGWGENPKVCPMAREAGKANWSCARQVIRLTSYSKSTPSRRNGSKATAYGGGSLLVLNIGLLSYVYPKDIGWIKVLPCQCPPSQWQFQVKQLTCIQDGQFIDTHTFGQI